MNYTDTLLELIKSKKEIADPQDTVISISVADIADIWERKNILIEGSYMPLAMVDGGRTNQIKYLSRDFMKDIYLSFKKLESDKIIKFKYIFKDKFIESGVLKEDQKGFLISDIQNLYSLEDKIFFETTKEFDKHFQKDKEFKQSEKNESSHWITKDKDGYFFDNKLLIIKNPTANYFIIFDAVYHLAKNGGKVEYEKIIECCKKRNLPKTTRKKIQKALTGESADFFKHIKGVDRILSGGINLFEANPNGNFLTFNNKRN